MAKKEKKEVNEVNDIVEGEDLKHNGGKPDGGESPSALVGPIDSEEKARAFVKAFYAVPSGCRLVIVTEDRNVFWQENASSAVNHAQKKKLKLFRLSWD